MGEDFGIGFGRKLMIAVRDELLFQRLVVLDNAVMHQRDFAASVEMWVGVFIGNLAVRSPASVADSVVTTGRLFVDQFRQRRDASGAFPRLDVIAVYNGNSGRVVATIFQTAQPIEQDGSSFSRSNITNNSTHNDLGVRY